MAHIYAKDLHMCSCIGFVECCAFVGVYGISVYDVCVACRLMLCDVCGA